MDSPFGTVALILTLLVAFWLFTLPINIGEAKGLPRSEMRPIRILNWCALLAGITWFIALYLAVTAEGRPQRRR